MKAPARDGSGMADDSTGDGLDARDASADEVLDELFAVIEDRK